MSFFKRRLQKTCKRNVFPSWELHVVFISAHADGFRASRYLHKILFLLGFLVNFYCSFVMLALRYFC